MKEQITILRKWNHPKIFMWVSNEEIGLKMDLEGFKEALKEELGSPTWIVRKKTLSEKIDQAFKDIISEMKKETKTIV